MGSSMAAIWRAPSASWAILPGFIFRRFIRLGSVFAASAATMSSWFARMMSASFSSRASAMRHRSFARWALERFCGRGNARGQPSAQVGEKRRVAARARERAWVADADATGARRVGVRRAVGVSRVAARSGGSRTWS